MGDLLKLIWNAVAGLFRARAALQAEVLALRHQLNVLKRRAPKRVSVSNIDRLVFARLYHLAPEVLDAVKILKAGDHYQMASRWVPSLVALEIKAARRHSRPTGLGAVALAERICGEADRLDPTGVS
jgi:hypothetical protein